MLWGQVAGYTDLSGADEGKQRWGFILRSGAPNTKIYKGSTFVSFGKAGDGYIHESVVDGTAQAFTRYATWSGANPYTPANRAVHVQIGDLINTPGTGAVHQWGIAAGNNIGNAEANFTGIVAGSAGVRIYNSAVSQYNGALRTGAWSQTGNLFLGTDVDDADKRALSFFASSGTLQIGNPNYPGTVTVYGTISVQAAGTINYTNLSGKPSNLADINSAEGTKLGGIAPGATVGATWGTNLLSVPARFGDTAGAAGLYLTPSYMGYWTGSAWTAYIRNNGEFYFKDGTSTNYLEWTAGGVLHGVGGGSERWAATSDGINIATEGSGDINGYLRFKSGSTTRAAIGYSVIAGVADHFVIRHLNTTSGSDDPTIRLTGAKTRVDSLVTTGAITASDTITGGSLTTAGTLRGDAGLHADYTPSTAPAPNTYADAVKWSTYSRSTNGIPGTGTWASVNTLNTYHAASVPVHQIAYTGDLIAWRTGTYGAGWDAWQTIAVRPNSDSPAPSPWAMGRVRLGYISPYSDAWYMAHEDHFTATNFAIGQDADGRTVINASAATSLALRTGNSANVEIGETAARGKYFQIDNKMYIRATAAPGGSSHVADYVQLYILQTSANPRQYQLRMTWRDPNDSSVQTRAFTMSTV